MTKRGGPPLLGEDEAHTMTRLTAQKPGTNETTVGKSHVLRAVYPDVVIDSREPEPYLF